MNSILSFGKYAGRSVEDTWTGRVIGDESSIIKTYLQELFDYLAAEAKPNIKIPVPTPDWSSCRSDLERVSNSGGKFGVLVTQRYCIIETVDTTLQGPVANVIRAAICRDFRSTVYGNPFWGLPGRAFHVSENSREFLNLQANPDYIDWGIREIDNFFVDLLDIEHLENQPCRYLSTFVTNIVKDDIIEYIPIFEEFRYSLYPDTKTTNQSKIARYQRLTQNNTSDLEDFLRPSRRYDDWDEPSYCWACESSPCMCSDPDRTSTVF